MTFQELQNLIDENFNTNKLADIARELDVSPQVVSNWKSRDQVPYKYVKLIRKKIKDLNEADLRDNLKNINPYQRAVNIITSSSKDDNEEEIDLFNLIAKFFFSSRLRAHPSRCSDVGFLYWVVLQTTRLLCL